MKLILNLKVNGVGFHNGSVLSIYLMFLDDDNREIKTVNRHYYPREKYNHTDITLEKTDTARNLRAKKYPKYFDEDLEIRDMIEDGDVKLIIGHNVMFDISFISKSFKNYDAMDAKNYFCSMFYNTILFEIPLDDSKNTKYFKFPTFKKTLVQYKIIKFDKDEYSSRFYVNSLKDIYIKTVESLIKNEIVEFKDSWIIEFYKQNLINKVMGGKDFKEIDMHVSGGKPMLATSLPRKYKKIISEYNITPSMTFGNENEYSERKLEFIYRLVKESSLEFTTLYPRFKI